MYTTPVMGFIDEHCAVFDDEEENKLEFTVVHAEFKRLVESLLSDFLREVGVPPERFVDVLANSAHDELNDFVLASILTVDDFPQFKAMMVSNAELDREAADELRDADAANAGPPTPDTAEGPAEAAEGGSQNPNPNPNPPAAALVPSRTESGPGPDLPDDGFDEAAIQAHPRVRGFARARPRAGEGSARGGCLRGGAPRAPAPRGPGRGEGDGGGGGGDGARARARAAATRTLTPARLSERPKSPRRRRRAGAGAGAGLRGVGRRLRVRPRGGRGVPRGEGASPSRG